VLISDGLVIKAVPRPHHLKELRETLIDQDNPTMAYRNEKSAEFFKTRLRLLDVINVIYAKNLNKEETVHLVQMTPLVWSPHIRRDRVEIPDVELR